MPPRQRSWIFDDIEHNVRDGLHVASLAGAWIALVCGFGGMRDHAGILAFKPRLPPTIAKLGFRIVRRGLRLEVRVGAESVTYELVGGAGENALVLSHYGEQIELRIGERTTKPIPPSTPHDEPTQPRGREPKRRSPGSG